MYLQALKLANEAHSGQNRKDSNVPYIIHPIRVSGYFNDDFRKTVAILHDILEDTEITKSKLLKLFTSRVVQTVEILTHREGENYFDYIRRVAQNEIATEIKIADIADNLSDNLSMLPQSILERYTQALNILIN